MLLKEIAKKFPFISVVQYGGNEYVGIVINQDQYVTSMYVYTNIRSAKEQKLFLELGDASVSYTHLTLPTTPYV